MATIESATDVRPFHIEVPEEELDDLRRRIAATRWPSKELVDDRSQGVQLATMQALARYWTNEYDWREAEARLNALPQFTTEIDGVEIHFIHVKSEHENALAADHDPRLARLGRSSCSRPSARSPIRPRTAEAPRTRSTSCCRPSPATASPPSRPSSAGAPAASRRPGRS